MSDIDQRLITLLRHNGRRSISDIAVELDVTRATVRAHMERLEQSGEIIGYTVILRSEAVGLPVRGITLIEIEGRATERILSALSGFSEISSIHTTNGKWDLIVELGAPTLSMLDDVLRRIRLMPGVASSETNLLLSTPRSTRARL